ncbi:MAG: RidA family protein [Planctomycetota bacterium]
MSGQTSKRLSDLGITLPDAPAAVGAYVGWVLVGNLVVTSGQLPWQAGKIAYAGKLGSDLTVEQGFQAARLCAIGAIAQLKAAAGDLDRVRRIVRLEGYVQSAPGFQGQPQVLNGASELFAAVFGERGQHSRIAVPTPEMPLNAAVQLAVWAEVHD